MAGLSCSWCGSIDLDCTCVCPDCGATNGKFFDGQCEKCGYTGKPGGSVSCAACGRTDHEYDTWCSTCQKCICPYSGHYYRPCCNAHGSTYSHGYQSCGIHLTCKTCTCSAWWT